MENENRTLARAHLVIKGKVLRCIGAGECVPTPFILTTLGRADSLMTLLGKQMKWVDWSSSPPIRDTVLTQAE